MARSLGNVHGRQPRPVIRRPLITGPATPSERPTGSEFPFRPEASTSHMRANGAGETTKFTITGPRGQTWPPCRDGSQAPRCGYVSRYPLSARLGGREPTGRQPHVTAVILSRFVRSPGHEGFLRARHVSHVRLWAGAKNQKRRRGEESHWSAQGLTSAVLAQATAEGHPRAARPDSVEGWLSP